MGDSGPEGITEALALLLAGVMALAAAGGVSAGCMEPSAAASLAGGGMDVLAQPASSRKAATEIARTIIFI
jgi:hypothetical protein